MKCPECKIQMKVIDSRWKELGWAVRRRSECSLCKQKYTTYEKIERLDTDKNHKVSMILRETAKELKELAGILVDTIEVERIEDEETTPVS